MPRPSSRQPGPVQAAVQRWLAALPDPDGSSHSHRHHDLLETSPKRFTIYEPMALLPPGSFASSAWSSILTRQDERSRNRLWTLILEELSLAVRAGSAAAAAARLTHLAVNEGIPLRTEGQAADNNVRRSPSKLRPLYGDFGPDLDDDEREPTSSDFARALWAATKQNGIRQTWAPRWTMFSRGNVKEKARLLALPPPPDDDDDDDDVWAVDLYAGIGYFAFSYAARGMRVLCWEINPWSVEALRRGAAANRWSVRVVRGHELQEPRLAETLAKGNEQLVVFLESNEHAAARIGQLQGLGVAHNVAHVNCGLLPTSEPSWRCAWAATRRSKEARLHLHENVGVGDLEARRRDIQGMFDHWAKEEEEEEEEEMEERRVPTVEHIEQVKTFAPGVWHCVYDVHIVRKTS